MPTPDPLPGQIIGCCYRVAFELSKVKIVRRCP